MGHWGRFNNRYRTCVSTIMSNSTSTYPFAGGVFKHATLGTHDYRYIHALVRGRALEAFVMPGQASFDVVAKRDENGKAAGFDL